MQRQQKGLSLLEHLIAVGAVANIGQKNAFSPFLQTGLVVPPKAKGNASNLNYSKIRGLLWYF
ncbi:hypothetical protein [Leclercia sp. M50]|uniref:hypothetical protein n=1 Tax=Leclercia sp. M50 TaxID=3081258 RepID=UPI00301981F4